MIPRKITYTLQKVVQKIPVLTLLGPRQSGKTTLVRTIFPEYEYINLERKDWQLKAKKDPVGFLDDIHNTHIILDEVQRVPDLLSYIQVIVDEKKDRKFVLTGSLNLLLLEQVSQSLAGRVIIFELLPLSYSEMKEGGFDFENPNQYIIQGGYPRLYEKETNMSFSEWVPSYIQTYIERDVRQIVNIQSIEKFQRFLSLCAARVGQIINYSQLASAVGVNDKTIHSWISTLKASYIIYTIPPFYENMGRRLIKSPKLYFWDTAVTCNLLGIRSEQEVSSHYLYGALFENFVLNEVGKFFLNTGNKMNLYFWRERGGLEVDLLLETSSAIIPVEIKASKTLRQDFFKNINKFKVRKSKKPIGEGFTIYRGDESTGNVISWKKITNMLTANLL